MCFNKEVSLMTGIIGIALCVYLFIRNNPNDRFISIAFISVAAMQFIEFFMWIGQSDKKINLLATKMGFLLLWAQPLVFLLSSLLGTIIISKIFVILASICSFLVFSIACLYIFNLKSSQDRNWITKPGKNGHLSWSFFHHYNEIPQFLRYDYKYLLPFLIFLTIIPFWKAIIYFGLLLFSFLYSILKYNKTKEFGTIWCWVSIFFIILFTILNSKNKNRNRCNIKNTEDD